MGRAPADMIEVELVYPLPHEQIVETVRVPSGATIGEVIALSRTLQRYPEISASSVAIGINGRRAELTQAMREFDRIEIYRPLISDPKRVRRARAQRAVKSPL